MYTIFRKSFNLFPSVKTIEIKMYKIQNGNGIVLYLTPWFGKFDIDRHANFI